MNYKLKIKLSKSELVEEKGIYFTIIVPSSISFLQLHEIIMGCTNYKNYHQWRFLFLDHYEVKIINDFDLDMRIRPFNPNRKFPELIEAFSISIKELFKEYKKAIYTYDFGDDNDFEIELLKIYDEKLVHGVVEFNGVFPPEDIGGIYGYIEFLKLLKKKNKLSTDEKHFVDHYKSIGYEKFDIEKANKIIRKIIGEN